MLCQLATTMSNFGGYKTLRPRLIKHCRGRVTGIPGGVNAYGGWQLRQSTMKVKMCKKNNNPQG